MELSNRLLSDRRCHVHAMYIQNFIAGSYFNFWLWHMYITLILGTRFQFRRLNVTVVSVYFHVICCLMSSMELGTVLLVENILSYCITSRPNGFYVWDCEKESRKLKKVISNPLLPCVVRKDRHHSISMAECQHMEMGTQFGTITLTYLTHINCQN
jgi:hypothetical protein